MCTVNLANAKRQLNETCLIGFEFQLHPHTTLTLNKLALSGDKYFSFVTDNPYSVLVITGNQDTSIAAEGLAGIAVYA